MAKDRLRLLVVASTFPARIGDGTPAFVLDLAQYEGRHFETMIVVPRVPGSAPTEDVGGVRVERFPYFVRRWETLADGAIIENIRAKPWLAIEVIPLFAAEAIAVRRAIRRFRPDVMHLHWIVPQGIVGALAARRIPTVLSTLGGDVYALNGPVWRRLKSRAVRHADAVTTMSSEMRERLLHLGAHPANTHVLPMGVDLDSVRGDESDVQPVPGRIAFAGRLVEKKGVPVLLDALRRLEVDVAWSLQVIGDGPLRPALEAAAAGLPVEFAGQLGREDFVRALREAEVVVLPSVQASTGDQEGLPVTLLEAMSVGRAVVASNLAGINDAIVDGESGILFPPGDAHALAEALRTLLTDPRRRAELGNAAARRAESYSIETIGARFVELLRSVATGRAS